LRRSALLLLLSQCPTQPLDEAIDLSVNDAEATARPAEPTSVWLRAEAGTNPVGAFGGSGVGNKVIAGLAGLDGAPLAGLTSLSVTTRGEAAPYFNAIVDLGCDGSRLALVVASGTPAEPAADGALRTTYPADAAQWRAVGGLDDLLPGHLDAAAGRLTDVSAAYPSACLRDADTGDAGLPAGEVTSAVLLILGDSRNLQPLSLEVTEIRVSGLPYEFGALVDHSVNRALVTPGRVLPAGLALRTGDQDLGPGAFYGPGAGNKAIAGLPGLDGIPLSHVLSVAWRALPVAGAGDSYMNLIVDLACDHAQTAIVVAAGSPALEPDDALRYAFRAADPRWRAVGGLDDLLPGHTTPGGGRLIDVSAAYPSACLRDADTGDAGLPADTVTPAAMVILGDSVQQAVMAQRITHVQVGPVSYTAD
jgi:hypothetical protein